MSLEENKEIVRRFNDVWNHGNVEVIDQLAAPDCILARDTVQGFKTGITNSRAWMPDLHLQIHEVLAEGDLVAMGWTMTGTAGKGDSAPGVWPAGAPFTMSGITIYTVRDGKIVGDNFVNNYTEMLVKAGGIPMRSPQST